MNGCFSLNLVKIHEEVVDYFTVLIIMTFLSLSRTCSPGQVFGKFVTFCCKVGSS